MDEAEPASRAGRAVAAMVVAAALFAVVFAITPRDDWSAPGIGSSGAANRHETVRHESAAVAARTTTATRRERVRVGGCVIGVGVALLVLLARAASHRSGRGPRTRRVTAIHGRAPPVFLTSI